jgi:mannose-6-phosphate isomerase-like protein (cupin superfamily)
MDFRDKTVEIKTGEVLLVPIGVEHRPRSNGEDVYIMLVEPKQTRHTGELVMEKTVTQLDWL